jgi:hypothetical protein
MGRRDDDRHPPGDVPEDGARQGLALLIREHELLGEIGQDAEPVRARVDHEIDRAQLAGQIQGAVFIEGCGHHGEDACVVPFQLSHRGSLPE